MAWHGSVMVLAVAIGGCGLATSQQAATPAAAPPVTVLERGAEPRKLLRYDRAGRLDHRVTLTWRGSSSSSGATCVGSTSFQSSIDEVTLTGTLAGALPGRVALDLLYGINAPARRPFMFPSLRPDLSSLLPARFRLAIDAEHLAVDDAGPVANDAIARQQRRYREAVLDAVPRIPVEPVGAGARWQVASVSERGASLATWQLVGIDGDRLTVVGTIVENPLEPSPDYSQHDKAEVRATVDLASFTLEAEVVRVGYYSGGSPWGGSNTVGASAKLSIAPRR